METRESIEVIRMLCDQWDYILYQFMDIQRGRILRFDGFLFASACVTQKESKWERLSAKICRKLGPVGLNQTYNVAVGTETIEKQVESSW